MNSSTITYRSICPFSSSLDIFGDKWTLIIIRDMLFFHKSTFTEFSSSRENVASNILSNRLSKLSHLNIIAKEKSEQNRKVNIYKITQKGLHLAPILLEMTLWFCNHEQLDDEAQDIQNILQAYQEDKNRFIRQFVETYPKELIAS